jgi:hypothetical protein
MDKEQINLDSINGDPSQTPNATLSDENFVPVQDGGIPLNSKQMTNSQFEELNGTGNEQISFQQGNYNQILGYPKLISDKVSLLNQTFVPLIEIALIELLGSNQLYIRNSGTCALSFQNNQISIAFTFVYMVNGWVGIDIDRDSIAHDSLYVFNKIKPVGANITQCSIDTESGQLIIQGTI